MSEETNRRSWDKAHSKEAKIASNRDLAGGTALAVKGMYEDKSKNNLRAHTSKMIAGQAEMAKRRRKSTGKKSTKR